MWALLDEKIVNKEFCRKSPSDGNKWQYQDNFFSVPDTDSSDFIEEISRPEEDNGTKL